MRFSALIFSFSAIVLGLTQVAALVRPEIVRDSVHRRWDDHVEEVRRWSSSLYQSTVFPPLAGAAIQEIAIQGKLKAAVNEIVTSAGAIIEALQNVDLKEFQDRLDDALPKVFEELQNEFSEPLPEDKTERYKRQETMITQAVEKIEDTLVDICSNWKIPEDTVRAGFNKVKPHLKHTLLIVAKLVNNHPDLVWLLSRTVIFAIIPEGFILGPILRFFVVWALSKVPSLLAVSSTVQMSKR